MKVKGKKFEARKRDRRTIMEGILFRDNNRGYYLLLIYGSLPERQVSADE